MRCGTYVRCLALGLIPTLAWSARVCAQSSQAEGCVVRGPSDPQSAAIVIDSLEFQDDAGLTPEMRGPLVDKLTHRTFHVRSAEDAGWQDELRDEIRRPLQEPGTTIDEDARRIDLTLKLEVGAQYRVGALAIHGFDSEAEKFLKSKFEVGQVFDATAVHEFFRANRAVWMSGTHAENGLTLARDASSGTVGLVFEH